MQPLPLDLDAKDICLMAIGSYVQQKLTQELHFHCSHYEPRLFFFLFFCFFIIH